MSNSETLVADSWHLCCSQEMQGACEERVLGKPGVRAVFHVMGKEKFRPEKRVFRDLSEIACGFADELKATSNASHASAAENRNH